MITTQAAVLWQSGTDWKVEEITLDEPRQGEVLVRVAAAGLCHSEEHHVTGDVLGRVARRAIPRDRLISWDDLQ